MKRVNYLSLLLILCIISCNLFACQSVEKDSAAQDASDSVSQNASDPASQDTPNPYPPFAFNTYNEFIEWISAGENEQRDDPTLGDAYYNFVKEASENQSMIFIPFYDGSAMQLREKEGFSGILFMPYELYGLPWIWYFGTIDSGEVVIKQAGLSQEYLNKSIDQNLSQFIKELAPDAPNTHNAELYPEYKAIKEKTIMLSDYAVPAMIYEFKNDDRVSVLFLYGASLFMVTAEEEVFDFPLLSLVPMSDIGTSDVNEIQ